MRLSTNATSESVLAQLQRLSSRQADLQRQVATGQRIQQAGDDPAAAARIVAARVERGSVLQYARNASVALEYSKTAYDALSQVKSLSDRASELAVLGAGSLGPEAMTAYAAEVDQLLEQAAAVGNTRFRNDYVFAGAAVDTPPFAATRDAAGRITAVAYAGDAGRLSIPIAEGAVLQPSTEPADNAGLADFMNRLVALRDALAAGSATGLQNLRPGLESSEDLLVGALSAQGAVQMRIEVAKAGQTNRLDELERQISADADADLPEVIIRLNQTAQAYEAALSSSSQILKLSLLDYLR